MLEQRSGSLARSDIDFVRVSRRLTLAILISSMWICAKILTTVAAFKSRPCDRGFDSENSLQDPQIPLRFLDSCQLFGTVDALEMEESFSAPIMIKFWFTRAAIGSHLNLFGCAEPFRSSRDLFQQITLYRFGINLLISRTQAAAAIEPFQNTLEKQFESLSMGNRCANMEDVLEGLKSYRNYVTTKLPE